MNWITNSNKKKTDIVDVGFFKTKYMISDYKKMNSDKQKC